MRTRIVLDGWSASLLAAMGILPQIACSASSVPANPHNDFDAASDTLVDAGTTDAPATDDAATGDAATDAAPPKGPFACMNPRPLLDGVDTGYEVCESGFVHRTAIHACPSKLPRPPSDAGAPQNGCSSDADCTAHPNGFCSRLDPTSGGLPPGPACYYGCTSDSDCGTGHVCLCGDPVGLCVAASCTTDTDCGDSLCTMSTALTTCPSGVPFACQTPNDGCGGDLDCRSAGGLSSACSYGDAGHQCAEACVFGRPFLVQGTAHVAGITRRGDWTASARGPDLAGLNAMHRAALGRAWVNAGKMEHASIAAFARFALQLLSLGAPASLVEGSHQAMRDETEHTKLCFALASAYVGHDLGPGPLAVGDALTDLSAAGIVVTTILEGCIGETVAAAEAVEALGYVQDPAVRRVLSTIAEDEKRHAELAWRTLTWALTQDPSLAATAAATFARALAGADAIGPADDTVTDAALLAFGVVPDALRRDIRRRVLREVVAPCAKAVLAMRTDRDEAVGPDENVNQL